MKKYVVTWTVYMPGIVHRRQRTVYNRKEAELAANDAISTWGWSCNARINGELVRKPAAKSRRIQLW